MASRPPGARSSPAGPLKPGRRISQPKSQLPKDFDVLFFGGIKEGRLFLKDMRKAGLNQVFACGDGCWSVGGFIKPAEGASTAGGRPHPLGRASARSQVHLNSPSYKDRFGPINTTLRAPTTARVVMNAIEAAATKKGMPDRADVLAALKDIKFQGVAYAAPEAFDAKGDNIAAVIFVNDVDGDRFREIDQIGGERQAAATLFCRRPRVS